MDMQRSGRSWIDGGTRRSGDRQRRWKRGVGGALLLLALLSVACDSPSAPEPEAEVASIELTPEEMQLVVGDTVRVQAMPYDADGKPLFDRSVRWVVGHSSVIEVSGEGLVQAMAEGYTFVKAIAGDVHASAWVEVIDPSAPAPTISALEPSSAVAGSGAFTLVVRGSAFGPGSVVVWGGDELETTRVSDGELRAAVAAAAVADVGAAEVRVLRHGSESEPSLFAIVPSGGGAPGLTSLAPAMVPAGSLGFTLTVTGSGFAPDTRVLWNGMERPTQWIDAGELRAQISVGDVWTPGTAQVTTSGGDAHAGAGPLFFSIAPSGVGTIEVTPAALTLAPESTATLQVRLLDGAGSELDGRHVSFSSRDGRIATVFGDGEVQAVYEGTVEIRVSSGDQFTLVPVTVTPAPVYRIFLSQHQSVVLVGGQVQLSAQLYAASGHELFGRQIVWSSSDGSVASVSPAGLVTAHAKGTVQIWAESEGKRASAPIEVRALPVGPVWSYDLRRGVPWYAPTVGDTIWVDEGGTAYAASFILDDASITLDRYQGRWSQTMVWDIVVSGATVGEVERHAEGVIGYDFGTGGYVFLTDDTPPSAVATAMSSPLGDLNVYQAIGTSPTLTYHYVIR